MRGQVLYAAVRVAVVVPFLNEARLFPVFLRSMAAQTRPPDVLLLVDDGSTDDSPAIAEAFAEEHEWVRLLRRPPRPPARDRLVSAAELRAFHWAIEQLHREDWDVVAKMDADFDLAPDHLEVVMRALEGNPDLGIAGTWLSGRQPDGTLVREVHPLDSVRGWHEVLPSRVLRADRTPSGDPGLGQDRRRPRSDVRVAN
jgi:glycosyltransferase involved in cell wall biosynthesis